MKTKMKKMFMFLVLVLTLLTLTGCGNYMMFESTYEFNKVHVHNEDVCYEIKSWTDYEGEQLQVQLLDGTVLLVSNINATLVKGECPFCKE